jgi:hypothetical protein
VRQKVESLEVNFARSAASTGSMYSHSSARSAWPETLIPKLSPKGCDTRNMPWSRLCSPPVMLKLADGAESGERVRMWSTPLAVFGP